MIRCLPQIFLLAQGGTLERLKQDFGIESKWHPKHTSLVQLKYNQISSPMGDPLVQQCRGIILDAAAQYRPVAWPFDKFFNHGETHAAPVTWGGSHVQEKLDGSLCILYFYNGEWNVATSGTPDAGGEVWGNGFTFAQLFWSVFKEKEYVVPPVQDVNLTFMFELTTPYNRVVVRHRENNLRLIGVRNVTSGHEMHIEHWDTHYDTVPEFALWSLVGAIQTFDTMNPLQQEGYVVCDKQFRRIKLKHPGYVAIHHLKDGFGPRRIVEVIQKGETEELLAHFPEWGPAFERVQRAYDQLHVHLHVEYNRLKDIEVQKDFALEAVKTQYPPALFQVRSGRAANIKEALSQVTTDKLYDLLGVRDVELDATVEAVT